LAIRASEDLIRASEDLMVGAPPKMVRLRDLIVTIANTDAAVLVTGESGTGKELVARMIHERSPRADKPFVAVNCAAVPPALIEAELFGHERGAFTGAVRKREGRFKAADGGTLFLDEIAEMPGELQSKLLRAVQEGTFEPIGTNTETRVDVRLISATNRDLKAGAASGAFRGSLSRWLADEPPPLPDESFFGPGPAQDSGETDARELVDRAVPSG
jgi:transcriptional regulator with GAF, ATPase, and Fis domain